MTTDDDVQLVDDEEVSNQGDVFLDLVCFEEELNDAQKEFYNSALKEHNNVKNKLKEILGKGK